MTNLTNTSKEPIVIADHLALDMINTIPIVNKQQKDLWETDDDVIYWLNNVANIKLIAKTNLKQGELLNTAKELREVIRNLVVEKKSGKLKSTDSLKPFLEASLSWVSLEKNAEEEWQQVRYYKQDTAKQLLGPIAEATVELLAKIDFNLVRACEHEECVLWFLDKTKTHKRRWCSMAVCGNRHKVAKYRKQNKSKRSDSDSTDSRGQSR